MPSTFSPAPPTPIPWENNPSREILRLAWPSVISLTSFSLMSLVDTLFVGRLGASALAGAGLGGVLAFTIASFGLGVISAAKVDVARSFGAGNAAAVQQALGAFLRLALGLGLISTLIAQLVASSFQFLPVEDNSNSLASEYLVTRSLGFSFVLATAAIGQWLQAQGDSRSAMRAALVANLINVPLNYLFIFSFDWGLRGAGFATALARCVEFLWLLRQTALTTSDNRKLHLSSWFTSSSWRPSFVVLRLGMTTGLERVLDMIAFAMVPLLLAVVGSAHVAAHQIVLQISLFSFLPIHALSEAISVLISQALGANRPRILRSLSRLGLLFSLAHAGTCSAIAVLFASSIAPLFTPDSSVIEVTKATLLVMAPLLVLHAIYFHLKGILRGFSLFHYVAWVTIACAWIVTPPLTYLLGVRFGGGAVGAWQALCLEIALGVVLLSWKAHQLLSPK